MSASLVSRQDEDGLATLTLNHPQKRNALSVAMLSQLSDCLREIAPSPSLKVVIIRAEGPVFCAGHDLREIASNTKAENEWLFQLCSSVMQALHHQPQAVIAQVHALATAAGCQLVASCDLAIAADTASFATPGVKIGLFCTTPGVALARAIPRRKALEMLFTGEPITALEAERLGLVNRVVPAESLAAQTRQLALQIARSSGEILKLGKRAFYEQIAKPTDAAYGFAEGVMTKNACHADAQEGMQAFLEKRPPKWRPPA